MWVWSGVAGGHLLHGSGAAGGTGGGWSLLLPPALGLRPLAVPIAWGEQNQQDWCCGPRGKGGQSLLLPTDSQPMTRSPSFSPCHGLTVPTGHATLGLGWWSQYVTLATAVRSPLPAPNSQSGSTQPTVRQAGWRRQAPGTLLVSGTWSRRRTGRGLRSTLEGSLPTPCGPTPWGARAPPQGHFLLPDKELWVTREALPGSANSSRGHQRPFSGCSEELSGRRVRPTGCSRPVPRWPGEWQPRP